MPNIEDAIKQSLNLTGNFLEVATKQKFLRGGWKVLQEEPYEFWPAWGGNKPNYYEGTADIYTSKVINIGYPTYECIFAIECKKADPKAKYWVFEQYLRQGRNSDFSEFIVEQGEKEFWTSTQLMYADNNLNESVAVKGYEFNDRQGALNNNQSEKIYTAARQANDALNGLLHRPNNLLAKLGRHHLPIVYCPVVITTANLMAMEYDIANVDLATGTVEQSKLHLRALDYLLYDFPLLPSTQYPVKLQGTSNMIHPHKRATFVVSATKIEEFIGWYTDRMAELFD